MRRRSAIQAFSGLRGGEVPAVHAGPKVADELFGVFRNDPVLKEVARRGAEYRKSQRPDTGNEGQESKLRFMDSSRVPGMRFEEASV
jgi:hypothetical protein